MSQVPKAKRNYFAVIGGVLLAILGMVLLYYGGININYLLMIAGFLMFGAGGFVVYRSWKHSVTYKKSKSNKENPENCLNIYPDRVAFEYMDEKNLQGKPKQSTETGKYYFINIFVQNKLIPFSLPDTERGDNPREIGDVLQSDIIRRCLSYVPTSKIQMISMGVAVGIIALELIALVVI